MAKKKPGLGYHLVFWFVSPLLAVIATVSRLTWRIRGLRDDDLTRGARWLRTPGTVLACWHQRHLGFLRMIRGTQATVLVSLSPDGEIIARTLHVMGHHTVRGSSTRRAGGGLRDMTAAAKAGRVLCFMADGPKGPIFRAKVGTVAAARDAGAGAVIPSTCAISWALTLKSWDRLQIPLPFAKIVYAYGDPIPVPADADRAQLEACRQQLEDAMRALTADCDRALGRDPMDADAHARAGKDAPA